MGRLLGLLSLLPRTRSDETPEPVGEVRTCPHCRMSLRYGCREICMEEEPCGAFRQVVRCAICGRNSAWLWADGFPDGPALLLLDRSAVTA